MTKLFIFDLGNVILPFEHRQIADKLYERAGKKEGFTADDIFAYLFELDSGSINDYEEGLTSSYEFFLDLRPVPAADGFR